MRYINYTDLLTVDLISMGVDLGQGSLLRVDQSKGQSDTRGITVIPLVSKRTFKATFLWSPRPTY